jgi:hypothetical protein
MSDWIIVTTEKAGPASRPALKALEATVTPGGGPKADDLPFNLEVVIKQLKALDEAAFNAAYRPIQAEYMRRRRARSREWA